MFIRNESFYTFRKNYPIVTILVAIHLILFIWMNFLPFGNTIYQFGVGYNLAVAHGEYWRLVTPIFMHVTVGHVLFNSFSLVLFGPALERMLGKGKFLIVYLLSGIIANIATYYLGGLTFSPHLGASGAIFGLFGVYLYMVVNRRDLIDQTNGQMVVTILVIGLVMTFINSNINIFAHIFGLVAGAVLAPFFLKGARPYYIQMYTANDPDEISFRPNRHKNKKLLTKIIWIIFAILVLAGIMFRFL